MICQICGRHKASILVRQITDEKTKELYMCRSCAQKYHLSSDNKNMHLSLKTIFERAIEQCNSAEDADKKDRPLVCPECGTSLHNVEEKKILGCPRCFFYFRDTVIKCMQNSSKEIFYQGVLPRNVEIFSGEEVSVRHLEEELQKAVDHEEYELAAYLRDKIKEREVLE